MIQHLDQALKRYKHALRRHKALCSTIDLLREVPGVDVAYISRENYRAILKSAVRLQGMAEVLGLRKREVVRICTELGLPPILPRMCVSK